MKVVRINKTFRNGYREHFLVFEADMDIEAINDSVENWCEKDPGGGNYGYSFEWEFIEDKALIRDAITKEINRLNNQIQSLLDRKSKMEEFILFREKRIDEILK